MSTDHYDALFDSTYLRWCDLQGKPALVEITKLQGKVEMTVKGGAKKRAPVMGIKQIQGGILKGDVKPLVLNKTNAESIAAIHGTAAREWVGKQIVLFETTTECKGNTVNCIRIRASKQKADQ